MQTCSWRAMIPGEDLRRAPLGHYLEPTMQHRCYRAWAWDAAPLIPAGLLAGAGFSHVRQPAASHWVLQ